MFARRSARPASDAQRPRDVEARDAKARKSSTFAEKSAEPPKPPKPVTAEYLRRAALHYLERYACSSARLGRVLARKVERRARARGEEASAFAPLVAEAVEGCVRAGLVDNRAFAEAKAASLRRRGTSARGVRQKLAQKGVDRETVGAVMDAERAAVEASQVFGEHGEEPADPEWLAAHAHARRKRLGPYRPPAPTPPDAAARAARRTKDLAAMARAGFSFDLARRVLDGEREA